VPFGNYSVGTNSTDFEFVSNIEPYYSLIEVVSCTTTDGKLTGIGFTVGQLGTNSRL